MNHISPYSGVAGETVRLFARVGTFFLVIPAIIFMALTAALLLYVINKTGLPQETALLVGFIAVVPVIGSAGIGARSGDMESGISYLFQRSGEVFSFTLRYALLTLAWSVPTVALTALLIKRAASGGFFNFNSFQTGITAVWAFALVIVVLLAPVFTLIVALSTESVRPCFSKQRWQWLLFVRGGDLKPLFAAYFGGMALFYIINIPIVVIGIVLFSQISFQAAFMAMAVGYYIPLAAAPVFIGRLAGGFVSVDILGTEVSEGGEAGKRARELATTDKVQKDVELSSKLKEIGERAGADLPGAIAEVETLLQVHPDHPYCLADISSMYASAGREEEAKAAAVKAIDGMFRLGETARAMEIFMGLGKGRRSIRISSNAFQRLSQTLAMKNHFDDAIWSLQAGEAAGLDTGLVQKGIVSAAETATRTGETTKAVQIYDFFIKKYPESDFIGYVQGEAKKLKARMEKESNDGGAPPGTSGGTSNPSYPDPPRQKSFAIKLPLPLWETETIDNCFRDEGGLPHNTPSYNTLPYYTLSYNRNREPTDVGEIYGEEHSALVPVDPPRPGAAEAVADDEYKESEEGHYGQVAGHDLGRNVHGVDGRRYADDAEGVKKIRPEYVANDQVVLAFFDSHE